MQGGVGEGLTNDSSQGRTEADKERETGAQSQFAQERRARSSLSNRNHSGNGKRST